MFTNESKFNIFAIGIEKTQHQVCSQNFQLTVNHGGCGVMVWGCMVASGVGELKFIEGKIDKFMHKDILMKNLKKSVHDLNFGS